MSKHWKGFVAANIVAGAAVAAALQIEQDTRSEQATYYHLYHAKNAVDASALGAACMAVVGVVGIHTRIVWGVIILATIAPVVELMVAQSIVLPIAKAVHQARHTNKK